MVSVVSGVCELLLYFFMFCEFPFLFAFNSLFADSAAAPHDYISQPPASLPAIRANLAILQTLINNQDDSNELAQIASALRAIVYPVCEKFIDDALSVVADLLQCRLVRESIRESGKIDCVCVIVFVVEKLSPCLFVFVLGTL